LVKPYRIRGIIVPTAFSPNGDGLNDHLQVLLIDMKSLSYFKIFNKWGQQIFETSDANNSWDGTMNGQPQDIGNYVWLAQGIDNEGNVVNQHGQVVLIR
jgi:gliding motility-associated-like protein